MKVLQLHNHYRFRGGEDAMFEHICAMLREHGHSVTTYEKRSGEIGSAGEKIKAALTGIYSREAREDVRDILKRDRPDLVHVHNLYPLISPSVLRACQGFKTPVVMRCPNYRLVCPTGIHLRAGKACELCAGGREYWCALTNCRGNMVESTAMAARSYIVRSMGLIQNNVSMFVPPSECVKQKLVESGIAPARIRVVPNTVDVPETVCDPAHGSYVAYAGRISEEKGVNTLIEAAAALPDVPFRIAGEGPLLDRYKTSAPPNVTFLGHMQKEAMAEFYAQARIGVVPSLWLEAFGLVAAEAMAKGLPVIASRLGALPEIVDEEETGLLFTPGDGVDLARCIEALWKDPEKCREMGRAGREKVKREYAREVYYARIMRVYDQVVEGGKANAAAVARTARIA